MIGSVRPRSVLAQSRSTSAKATDDQEEELWEIVRTRHSKRMERGKTIVCMHEKDLEYVMKSCREMKGIEPTIEGLLRVPKTLPSWIPEG